MTKLIGGLLAIAIWVFGIAAWVTHVIVCIKASAWVLLVFGCLFFPVGVVHGAGVWFGIF